MKLPGIGILYIVLLLAGSTLNAQTTLSNQGGLVLTGGYLHLQNTDLINNGAITATDHMLVVSGDQNAYFGGTQPLVLDELALENTDLYLEQQLQVDGALHLAGNQLVLQDADLYLSQAAPITGTDYNGYVRTNARGKLIQFVDDQPVLYPVGNDNYNPVVLQNNGNSPEVYTVRVRNQVLANGYDGDLINQYVVNRTWEIEPYSGTAGNLDIQLAWNGDNELGYTDGDFAIAHYNGDWEAQQLTSGTFQDGLRTVELNNSDRSGLFAVFEDRNPIANSYECTDGDLLLNDPISDRENLHAADFLVAANVIEPSGNVLYTAGEMITLQPGFSAKAGAYFHAFIYSCSFTELQRIAVPLRAGMEPNDIASDGLQLKVFPNPFAEKATVQFFLPEPGTATMMITDLQGRTLYRKEQNWAENGWQQTEFSPGNLPSGLYLLRIQSKDRHLAKQIVVQ